MAMPQIKVYLDERLHREMRSRAQRAGVSVSQFTRDLLVLALDQGGARDAETLRRMGKQIDELHGWLGGGNDGPDSRGLRHEIEDLGELLWRAQIRLEQLGSPQLRQLFVRIYTYVDRLVFHQLGESQYRRVRDEVLRGAAKILSELDAPAGLPGDGSRPAR